MTRTRKLDITQMVADLRAGIADHDETITRLTADRDRYEQAAEAAAAATATATEERAKLVTLLEHAEQMLPEPPEEPGEPMTGSRHSRNVDHAAILRVLRATPRTDHIAEDILTALARTGSDITERQVGRSLVYLNWHGVVLRTSRGVYRYDPDQDSGSFPLDDTGPAVEEIAQPVALDAASSAVPATA